MDRGEYRRTTLPEALAEDLQRLLEEDNAIPRSNLPPRPVPGRPTEDPNYVFVYNDGRSPTPTAGYTTTPEADITPTMHVSETTEAYEDAYDDYEDEDDAETGLLVAEVVPDESDYDEIVEDKPSHRRRNALIAVAAGVMVLAAVVGVAETVKHSGFSPEEKANLPQTVPTAAASEPVKEKQHKHKPKPSPAASQSPDTQPTQAPPTATTPPTAPEILIDPAAAPIPTGPTTFNIGSLNIYTNKNEEDQEYSIDKWQERLAKTNHVVEKHTDVVALRDVREEQFNRMLEADMFGPDEYGIFPAKYSAFAGRSPIVWKSDMFSLVEGQTLSGPRPANTDQHPNAITIVRLHDEQTNQDIIVVNGSLPNGRDRDDYQARADYAQSLAEIVRNLESHAGVPVFLAAGMSDDPNNKPTKAGSYTESQLAAIPSCTLTELGQLVNTYIVEHPAASSEQARDGECARPGKMPVDQFYTSDGLTIDSYSDKIGPKRNGSKDSQLIQVGVTIPVKFTQGVTGAS